MHIKKIVLSGFKSYKDKVEIELSPGSNIIVGKNGSGKSNIFAAVQFVLSNAFSNLSAEERGRLIYEESNCQSLCASVELVFDNADLRFPMKASVVSIKRVLSVKKDEFFINEKHSTQSTVESLLESAGISRQNSYFIVQQGKVNRLIKMSEKERLGLLKEIAGTRVYEDKRKESIALLKESESKSEQINEIIERIDKRRAELREEKGELGLFQEKDDERRAIEAAIYVKEIKKLDSALETLTAERKSFESETSEKTESLSSARSQKQNAVMSILSAETRLREKENEIKRNSAVLRRQRAKSVRYAELRKAVEKADEKALAKLSRLERGAAGLGEQSEREKRTVAALEKEQQGVEAQKAALERVIGEETTKFEILRLKSGQREAFASKAERDECLEKLVAEKRETVEADKRKILELNKSITETKAVITGKLKEKAEMESNKDRIETDSAQNQTEFGNLSRKRDDLLRERKSLWKELSELRREKNLCVDQSKSVDKKLRFSMSKEQYLAIAEIRKIVKEKSIRSYHGLLGELFEVKHPKFAKSVEKVAGGRLFFHVVEDDDAAAQLLSEMAQRKTGRATIMPLGQLRSGEIAPPDAVAGSDAVPMLEQLVFAEKFLPAMAQIFGKTFIARSLDAASDVSVRFKVDAITLDGDQAFRKGFLSGGHFEPRESRLALIKASGALRERIERISAELRGKETVLADVEAELKRVEKMVPEWEGERRSANAAAAKVKNDLFYLGRELEALYSDIEKMGKTAELLAVSVENEIKSAESVAEEMRAEFVQTLSEEEAAEMKRVKSVLERRKGELSEMNKNIFNMKMAQSHSENFRRLNLDCQLKETMRTVETTKERLSKIKSVLAKASAEAKECIASAKEAEAAEKDLKAETRLLRADLSAARRERSAADEAEAAAASALESLRLRDEELLAKAEMVNGKRAELAKKAGGCGESGEVEVDKRYESHTIPALLPLLRTVNADLKRFGSVNKKALDQFTNCTRQREDLGRRSDEQEKGAGAIRELIAHLDLKKGEVAAATFSAIARHFAAVFAELVPGGDASLQLRPDSAGIAVSFGDSGEATEELASLSGGQQTLVALALVFAVQRCDPTPFYFLDEVDANLDAAHRAAVTALLQRLAAAPTQVLSTTFRPELLAGADRCFVASFGGKCSDIRRASAEEASELVLGAEGRELGRAESARR